MGIAALLSPSAGAAAARDEVDAWGRALLSIYLVASVPYRVAFCPGFALSWGFFPGFVVLDLVATIFFSYEAICLARQTAALISPKSILPEFASPKEDSVSHSLRSHDDFADIRPPRTMRSILRVVFFFASTVPLEYLSLVFSMGLPVNYLLTNRLLRLFLLPRYLADLLTVLGRKGYLKNVGVQRIWLLFFTMALAGHLCGCIFFFVARQQALEGVALTWPEEAGIYSVALSSGTIGGQLQVAVTMESTRVEAYIKSLYWAYVTMVTTGFGDIVPLHIDETIVCICSQFVGVIITALTIGNLQRTIGQFDAERLSFQRKLELIKKYMHHRCLPSQIQERVLSFYEHRWSVLKGADEEQFLMELPRTLQQEVTNYMCRDIIASLPLLRRANRALLNALVECSEMNLFSPGDDVVRRGEIIRGALLVSQGEVEVLRGSNVERKMKRLDHFAQDCLFVDSRVSNFTVRSKGFSEIIIIPRSEFQQTINSQCDKEFIAQLRDTALALSKGTTKANKMFGSSEDITPTDGFNRYCHPSCFFRKLWDCFLLLGLVFYIVSIPLSFMHLVENTPFGDTPLLLCLGYMMDVFFWADAILEWNYFFYREEVSGLVVFDRSHIRQHFMQRHNLVREVVGLIPFDVVSCFFGGRFCHYFRLAKLVRIPNIVRYMESAEVMLNELKIDVDLSLYRVIKLNIVMIVVCHWCGCLWYMMASLSIALQHSQNWRDADENDPLLSISHSDFGGFAAYLRSVYWAIVGMSTVGYGDIVATNIIETTFSTCIILFGGLALPAVVGGLAAYLVQYKMAAKLFRKRISKVRMYLRRIKVGDAVLVKVSRYYDYHWSRQGGVVEQEVLSELPLSLRDSVASHVNGAMINSLPFLGKCDEATKQLIASILQPRVFMPGDCVVREDEQGFEMYFLKRGRVFVSSSSLSAPLRVLSKGDFFGESCLLGPKLSSVTVKAGTYCECFSLSRDDFKEALAGSPFASHVRADLANLLMMAKTSQSRSISNLSSRPKCQRLTMEPAQGHKWTTPRPSESQAVILPDSLLLLAWNALLLCICVYNAWIIPFRLAFDTSDQSIVVDWVIDAFFLLDMLLNYRFVACVQGGELVTDPRKIKANYVASRLKVDLASSLPLDLVAHYTLSEVPIVGKLLRVLKMIRLERHFGAVEKVFGYLEDRNIPLAGFRLVEFLSGVVLIAHWAACGFYFIARLKSNRADCSDAASGSAVAQCLWKGTWIGRQILDGKLPIDGGLTFQHYIRSFNWALPTLVVVVIGDVVPTTSPETLYAFLTMALGITFNAAVVGNVANIVANLESDSSDFARKVDEIRNYMHKHHLSYDLHARVDDFTRYLWTAHNGSTNEDSFILRLPYTLQTDVVSHTRTKLLLQCPFFDILTHDIVKAVALCLQPSQFCAGDIIIHAGDFGQSMFFLETGTVKVVPSGGGTVLATLTAGSYFGETSLFLKHPRASSVCAVTFCDVYECAKADLFGELRRRDIDIGRVIKQFALVHKKNISRQKAIEENLNSSKRHGTKLSKMIDSSDSSAEKMRSVMGMFMPSSLFRFCFDVASMASIIYFLVFVPYQLAFGDGHLVLFSLLVDLFFIVDFYLRSTHFAFRGANGSVQSDQASIFKHYKESGMFVDAVACLSVLEVLDPTLQLRLLSLMRIVRIPAFINKICDHLSLRGIRISLATSLLGKIIFFYAIANHWVACLWFTIHRYIERAVEVTWGTTDCPWGAEVGSAGCLAIWNKELGEHNVCNLDSMSDCYLRSLHFSLTTLSTVGYGDISPASDLETIFEQFVVLLGACFLAGLIGAFGAYLAECDTLGISAFKEKIQKLKAYMTYRDIPGDIQASILFFHQRRWKDSQTLDERETLRILPKPLQLDISFAVKQRAISLVPILDSLPLRVQQRIAHALILQVYSLRDHPIIYSQGDIGFEIFFISSGVVSVSLPTDLSDLDATGRANATANKEKFDSIGLVLGPGNHVGESCLASESGVRQETVTARTTTVEAYVLSREDLDAICRLMGTEKGGQLRNALRCRNKAAWHTFIEDDEAGGSWEDVTEVSNERRQTSYNSLPWTAQESVKTNRRRRRRRNSVGRRGSVPVVGPDSELLALVADQVKDERSEVSEGSFVASP